MGTDKTFTFDSVLGPQRPQVDCYRVCAMPLLDSYFDGFNATLLAYGQTGTNSFLSHAVVSVVAPATEHSACQPALPSPLYVNSAVWCVRRW